LSTTSSQMLFVRRAEGARHAKNGLDKSTMDVVRIGRTR
jgi:hypothetical protein